LARLFYACVLVGVVLAILVAGVYPLPQHPRLRSIINVIPDGGREETFSIRWPEDRVQPLQAGHAGPIVLAGSVAVLVGPEGVPASVEVFRLRDAAGNVVGLASRSTTNRGGAIQGSDWVLQLPSRGSLFLTQLNSRDVLPQPRAAGAPLGPAVDAADFWRGVAALRVTAGPAAGGAGSVAGGTEEFAGLGGSYDETWDLEQVGRDGATRGHITLTTRVEARD
jgi:hypothetical protein